MKFYLKVFAMAFLCFVLMLGSGFYAFTKYYDPTPRRVEIEPEVPTIEIPDIPEQPTDEPEEPVIVKSDLELAVESSTRVNVLVFGHDGGRADTIMFVSYDYEKQYADIMSIPRDTYHAVAGFDAPGQDKINAIYGFKEGGGSAGMRSYISNFLDVPIDYYIKVNYNGLAAIVDVVGGVTVNVPFDMKYDDEWADPPLHIDIPAGTQTLNGQKAMEYLRWRKNNGEEGTGDIGRIERQQEFVVLLAKRAMSLKFVKVVNTAFNYVKTDMPAQDIAYYASNAVGFDFNNLKKYQLPGHVGNKGYYIHDPEATEELLTEIFSR